MPGWVGISARVWRVWRTGVIARRAVRIRWPRRSRCGWWSCAESIHGGVRAGSLELLRRPAAWQSESVLAPAQVPSEATINRILRRRGLVKGRPRKRPRESFKRFERPGPMQLWGIDIVGGIRLVDVATGEVREAKVVTGVDDHSRFCVMAAVVERATGRAVCLAFAQALAASTEFRRR